MTRIIEQQQAISAVLAEDHKSWHLMPSSAKFTVLEALAAVLKSFSVLTDALSGEKEVSSSALRSILKHVLDNCLADKPDNDHLVTEMKSVIARDLCTRYESALISQLLDKWSILDPRFKATNIADRELTEFELQADVFLPSETPNSQCDPVSPSASDSATSSGDAAPPQNKKAKGLGAILAAIPRESPARKNLSLGEQFSKEMSMYLEQPCEDLTTVIHVCGGKLMKLLSPILQNWQGSKEVPLCTCYKCAIRVGVQ